MLYCSAASSLFKDLIHFTLCKVSMHVPYDPRLQPDIASESAPDHAEKRAQYRLS
jgi:hypothetical protein